MHYADMDPSQKLLTAAKEGNINGIKESIVSGVDIDTAFDYGMTALHFAANGGYKPCAIELIENGNANMNVQDDDGQTPLMLASTRLASVEVAKLLINRGADVEMKDNKGMTALMWATTHRNEKVVRTLLQSQSRAEVVAGKWCGSTSS